MINQKEILKSNDNNRYILIIIQRMFQLCWSIKPSYIIFLVSIKLLLALVPATQIYIMTMLVDSVTKVITEGEVFIQEAFIALALQLSLLLIQLGLNSLERLCMLRIQISITYHLEEGMVTKASKLPLVYFDQPQFYDQFQRSMSSHASFQIFQQSFSIVQNVITILTIMGVLFTFHWSLALGLFLLIIPTFWVNMRIGQQRYGQMFRQTPVTRKAYYLFNILTSRISAKEIKLFNVSSFLIKKWSGYYWKNANEQISLEKKAVGKVFSIDGLGLFMSTIIIGMLIWFGALGRVTVAQFVALSQAITSTQSLIQQTTTSIALMYQDALFAKEVFNYIDLPEESAPEQAKPFPTSLQIGLIVENLSFTYPGQATPSLKNLSFQIKAGETIAIVGDNGAGKTTLVKCLLGLYSPEQGEIRYDNIDLIDMDPEDVRNHVTAIFQDFIRYELTAKENIGLGRVEWMEDSAWMEVAASKSGASSVLETLPDGIETQLGPMFDGGKELSYGQWQKMALSRAIFRDAQVVVLDEPTASMDPLTEADMFEQFAQISEGKTTLLISHRLGICRSVDKILVLKQGELVEVGTHQELMNEKGYYAEMFLKQAKWYETEK